MTLLLNRHGIVGAGAGTPYSQNQVESATGYLEGNTGTGYDQTPYLEFSCWINPVNFTGGKGFFGFGLDTRIHLTASGQFEFRIENLGNTRILEMTTTGTLATGSWQHVYFAYNYRAGTWELKVDGSDISGTPTTGPLSSGSANIQFNKTFAVLAKFGGSGILNGGIADFWLDNPPALQGYAAFHDGGAPKDLSALAASVNPAVYLGGSMVASDWNSATNLGNQSLTLAAGSFTDV